jgi:hypothetical protein
MKYIDCKRITEEFKYNHISLENKERFNISNENKNICQSVLVKGHISIYENNEFFKIFYGFMQTNRQAEFPPLKNNMYQIKIYLVCVGNWTNANINIL